MGFEHHGMSQGEDELAVASLVDNMYRIVRLIGRGGMGAVYEAEDIRLGRPVALKVLRSDLAKQLQADERFLQEARVLARLRSPFVCTVYSIGATESGKTFIAMEYIDGESLGDLLDRERSLSVARSVKVTQRVAEALVEAHDLGIIHRDLKPDNILLTRIGSVDDYAKVVDLGLAKHIESAGASNNPRLTQTRLVLGTPAYMSPEQAAGHDVGPASDLYSLGVIFYEMVTGYLPIDGETPQDFLRAHQLQPPVPLRERRPDLQFPPSVQEFVDKALQKKEGDRFATASEFLEAMQGLERSSAEARQTRRTPRTNSSTPRVRRTTTRRQAEALDALDERLDRAKERVRLEMMGVAGGDAHALTEVLDRFDALCAERADPPVVVRLFLEDAVDRVPMLALFEEIRRRADIYDDDPPSMARRKLLRWVQGLMPDRPGRASQVAHLIGLFLRVEFPDSPHLSHARAVPEVARLAAGAAMADVFRALTDRTSLVLSLERIDRLTATELSFLRKLVRQLGATPVLVVGGWVGAGDEVPVGLDGLIIPESVATVPARDADRIAEQLADEPDACMLYALARQTGSPTWLSLLENAVGKPCEGPIVSLADAGALVEVASPRLSFGGEYRVADLAEEVRGQIAANVPEAALRRAWAWMVERSGERSGLWSSRMAGLASAIREPIEAARCARVAGDVARRLGATVEAIEAFDQARELATTALAEVPDGAQLSAVVALADSTLGLVELLFETESFDACCGHARGAFEALRGRDDVSDADWLRLGVPLLSVWSRAEVARGRAHSVVDSLTEQLAALEAADDEAARAQIPLMKLALGEAKLGLGDEAAALQAWESAAAAVAALGDPALLADLAIRISGVRRGEGDGEAAVESARRALGAARMARDLVREAEALRALAVAQRDIGDMDDAEAQLGEALNALGRVERSRLSAEVSVLLAEVLMARDAAEEADAALAKACRAFAAMTDLSSLANALRKRGEIQMAQGIYSRASAFADESTRQAVLSGDVGLQVRALLLGARAYAAQSDAQRSHQSLEKAFHLVAPLGTSVERAECLVALGDLLEAHVLTSDRSVASLLREAQDVFRAADAPGRAKELHRRLRAMRATPSSAGVGR